MIFKSNERDSYFFLFDQLSENYKAKFAAYLEGLSPEKRAVQLAAMMGLKRPKESQTGSQVGFNLEIIYLKHCLN